MNEVLRGTKNTHDISYLGQMRQSDIKGIVLSEQFLDNLVHMYDAETCERGKREKQEGEERGESKRVNKEVSGDRNM